MDSLATSISNRRSRRAKVAAATEAVAGGQVVADDLLNLSLLEQNAECFLGPAARRLDSVLHSTAWDVTDDD